MQFEWQQAGLGLGCLGGGVCYAAFRGTAIRSQLGDPAAAAAAGYEGRSSSRSANANATYSQILNHQLLIKVSFHCL